jgi:hypothetical protein
MDEELEDEHWRGFSVSGRTAAGLGDLLRYIWLDNCGD